jgi:signal transduction histidine kinase
MLAFGRKQMRRPEPLWLGTLLEEMRPELVRLSGEQIEVVIASDPDLPAIWADPHQVEQVILDLAANARDAMSQGGRLSIFARQVDLEAVCGQCGAGLTPGPYVNLIVADTGRGMNDEVKSHLFEPFFTTKGVGQGTGLGLSSVHGIVSQHQGHIDVDTQAGAGTTFYLYFPVDGAGA